MAFVKANMNDSETEKNGGFVKNALGGSFVKASADKSAVESDGKKNGETEAVDVGNAPQLSLTEVDYKEISASLKKELAAELSSPNFDKEKVRPLVENYASAQFKLFDENLKKGYTGIKPIGENLTNLFKAHSKNFNELYPDLAEIYSVGNLEKGEFGSLDSYAYQNSDAYREKRDKDQLRFYDNAIRQAENNAEKLKEEQREQNKFIYDNTRRGNIAGSIDETILRQNNEIVDYEPLIAKEQRDAANLKYDRQLYKESVLSDEKTEWVKSQPDFEEKTRRIKGVDGKLYDTSDMYDADNMGVTKDEYLTYVYITNTEGEDAAIKFLDSIKNKVKLSEAVKVSNELQKLEKQSPASAALKETGYALASGVEGLAQSASGIVDTFSGKTDYFMPGKAQLITQKNKEASSFLGNIALSAAEGLPQVAGTMALGAVNPYLGTAFLASTAFGSGYVDAINSGASRVDAVMFGGANAILEVALERAVGSTINNFGDPLSKRIGKGVLGTKQGQKIAKSFAEFANKHPKGATAISVFNKWLGNSSSEFVEEYLSETATPLLRNAFLGEENELSLGSVEQLQAGLVGFITGGILEGVRASKSFSNILKGGTALRIEQIMQMSDARVIDEYLSKISDAEIAFILSKENVSFNELDGEGMMTTIDKKRAEMKSEIDPDKARKEIIDSEKLVAIVAPVAEFAKQGLSYDDAIETVEKSNVDVSGFEEFAKAAYEKGAVEKGVESLSDTESGIETVKETYDDLSIKEKAERAKQNIAKNLTTKALELGNFDIPLEDAEATTERLLNEKGETNAEQIVSAFSKIFVNGVSKESLAYQNIKGISISFSGALADYVINGKIPDGIRSVDLFKTTAEKFKEISDMAVRQVSSARNMIYGNSLNISNSNSSESEDGFSEENKTLKDSPEDDTMLSEAKKLSATNDREEIKRRINELKDKLSAKYGEDAAKEAILFSADVADDAASYASDIIGKKISGKKLLPSCIEAMAADNDVDAAAAISEGFSNIFVSANISAEKTHSVIDEAKERIVSKRAELEEKNGVFSVGEEDVKSEAVEKTAEGIIATEEIATESEAENVEASQVGESVEVENKREFSENSGKDEETTENLPEVLNLGENAEPKEKTSEKIKPYAVTKTKHTSTGEDIWVVSLNDRISKEEFAKLRDEVKKNGGYYSRFAKTLDGKALPGFVFKSEPSIDVLSAFENDSVPTSPTAYSETEKKNWESSNSIVVYENDDQLDEFINEALDNINLNQKIYFGKIPEVTSQRIFKETDVDVSGYNVSLKKYEIRKILLNSHGDFQKENLRGQTPITPADIKLIPRIISNPDDVRLSKKEYEGKPALEFEKEIDNKKYVVAYVSRKHHDISVITMYKKRSLATAENANALSFTSETTNSTASTDIIAPKSSDVNTESTNVKENIENEREQTGILGTESEGHPGGNVSEEAQEVEEGRDVGRSGDDGSQDSVREVREDARLVEGEQTSSDGVQYREPDTGRDFDGELREHTDSEGRSDRTSDTSSRRLNSHNYKITEDIDSKRPNITDNIEAIKLLKSLEESGKKPTKEQQAILARYKGWGGLKNAFSDYYNQRQLKELLTDEEFANARASILNAHYTSTKVISGIYKGLARLGFKGGNVLEPSMGVGNFFGVMPGSIAGKTNLYGVEMDSLTGRIAKMLYPDAAIEISPFQDVKYPEGSFDAIVGNVPFSEITFPYKGGKYTLHDYFFLKSLDTLKEGGVAMLLTSTGTLDKLNVKARHEIAKRANLVAAFRLPNNAFETNAGTSVTTDLIVLQKRGDTVPFNGEPFEQIGRIGDIPVNEYFVNHPENILGKLVREKGMYAQERTQVEPFEGDFEKLWNKAISRLPKDLLSSVANDAPIDIQTLNSNKSHFEEKDGKVIFFDSETGKATEQKGKSAERAKGYIAVKDAYNNLLESARNGASKAERDALRMVLSDTYDSFNKKFGFLQDKVNSSLEDDAEFVKTSGLELYNPKTKKFEKSGIFTSDTIGYIKPVKADTSVDALAISINESGRVDFKRMSELVGKSKEEIAAELEGTIIETPDGDFELISTYASGNIREKLKAVEGKESFEKNVEILKAAMPKDKTPSEIVPQLGASWIDPKYIEDFIKETHNLGGYYNVKVNYDKTNGEWVVDKFFSNMHNMTQKYGTRRADAYSILVDTLNMKSTKVYDKVDDTRVLNTKETSLAKQKQAEVKEAFSNWIFKDADRRNELVKRYNELFNSHRNMDYSELAKYLTFPGLHSSWKMRDYQKTAVARVVFGGNTLLAHGVGTGKTSEMIASAMEMKRMGITRKNVMVVPKHKVGDFRNDILKMYPEAKVLMATEKDFKKENRGKLFSKIGTNDWDIVIVGHSSFGLLPVSKETQAAYIEKEKADLEEVITSARTKDGGVRDTRFVKALEKTLQSMESKLKALLDAPKDDTITFEELGIDGLFVDEAHNFKNLPFYTKLNLPGIKGGASKRASDLFMKTEYLRNSGGRIVFATATPVTNTISEIYNMTRFVSPETLEQAGVYSFDSWASTFGSIETKVEMSPDGKNFRTKERFAKYFNVSEMVGMFRQFADILKTSDVVKDLPKANYIDVVSPSLDIHDFYIENIVNRMKNISSGGQSRSDNMLLVTSDGRAMATDLRLIASQLEGYDVSELDVESSRINKAVRNIVDEYKKSNKIKGTQFVFLDFGMNANEGGRYAYDLYGDITGKLVKEGIPESEIAKIGDYDTQAKKDELFSKVNKGEIRVLIGSTAKMGEGMNAQERAVALHHLNAPYRPSDIEQREGRIIRYGNQNKEVNIYRYIQEKSFDSYMWQMLARKAEFINQAMSNGNVSEIEETDEFVLSAKTGMAVASGNPLILKKVEIDEEVKRLQGLKKSYDASYYEMQERLMKLPSEIEGMEKLMSRVSSDIETLKNNASEDFSIKLGKKVYDKRNDAAKALVPLVKNKYGASGSEIIGSYRGLNIKLSKAFTGSTLYLGNNAEMKIELSESAEGNITKIVNAAGRFDAYLEFLQKKQDTLKKELESVKADIDKPFKYQAQLDKAIAEQADIDSQLNFGEDNSDVVEDMNDEFEENEIEESYSIETEEEYESEEKERGGGHLFVGRRGRADVQDSRKQSGGIFGKAGSLAERTRQDRQIAAKKIRDKLLIKQTVVGDNIVDVISKKAYTDDMKEIVAYNKKQGVKTFFFVGQGTRVDGSPFKFSGLHRDDGTVFLSYDRPISLLETNRHELVHHYFDTEVMQKISKIIEHRFGRNRLDEITHLPGFVEYFDTYNGNVQKVFEEVVATLMSGQNKGSTTNEVSDLIEAFWNGDFEYIDAEFASLGLELDNKTERNPKNVTSYSLDDDGNYDFGDAWYELLQEYGYIPKGEKPVRDVDVPKKIDERRVVSRFARTMMEAGVTPDHVMSEFEKRILDGTMTHLEITNEAARSSAQKQIEYEGFEGALAKWNNLVDEDVVGKKQLVLGMELYNQCITNGDVTNAMKIAADLTAMATSAGQTLQACRVLKLMSPDGQLYYLEKSVDKMNKEFKKKIGEKFKDIELDENLMKEFLQAQDEETKNAAYDKICQSIADQIPSTRRDKWDSWRYLAMLGNPRTHIKNFVGNAVFLPAIRIKNMVGAIGERTFRVNKEERTRSFYKTKESKDFAKADFEIMKKTLQGENSKYATTGDIESRRTIFKNKLLETLRRKNFDYLEAEDMTFLKLHYVDALARVITARGIDVNNVDPETLDKIRLFAVRQAQEATYRDANALAEELNRIERAMKTSDKKAVRAASVLVEGVMPFKKTPLNIAKQGILYSPVSILTGISKTVKVVKQNGDVSVTEAIDDLAKGLTGTGLVGLGYLLASFGLLLGPDDEDEKKNRFDEMVGEQSYSFNVGGHSYTIDWMTPSSMPLFVGCELFNLAKDEFTFADITAALSSMTDPVFELSVLSGISNLFNSVMYGEGSAAFNAVWDMTTSYFTQALPTIGGQVSRLIDDNKREYYYTDKNSQLPSSLQRLIGQASSKMPFVSYLFEPSVDDWGREESYGGSLERLLENTVSPGYYSKETYTRVDDELAKLYRKTGDNSVFPTRVQKYYVSDGVYYYMNAEDYTEVKKRRGKLSFKLVKELIGSQRYKEMSDEEKAKAISKCYREAGETVKGEMLERIKRHSK